MTVKTIKTIAAIGDVGDDVTSEANVASKCSEGSVKTIEASVNNGYGNDYDGYGGAKGKEEEASPSGTRTDTNAGDAERLPWTE